MSIDVVAQPRIDHLVTGLDGTTLRRTDHRGIAWYGGRQAAQTGGALVVHSQGAVITSPFWVPDTLAYRTDWAEHVTITVTVGLLFVHETSGLAEVSARLAVNEQRPDLSHVLVHAQGGARVPLALSYDVTVLAPPDAVVG